MMERLRGLKATSPHTLGALLIIIGLVMFVVVFFAAFPVLSDPVGTYDDWFPEEQDSLVTETTVADEPEGPAAVFRYVAETTLIRPPEGSEEEPRFSVQVRFEDRSEPGEGEIVSWRWELGDGAESSRNQFTHRYEAPGVYEVRLDVEDVNGLIDSVTGEIEVPEEGITSGRIESDSLDLSGIESAVEDAVVALEGSVEDTLATMRDTSRNIGVVALFALAAIATTVVAWRVTRSGVLLLRPQQTILKVKSADMQVTVENDRLLVADGAAIETEPELIDA